MMIRSTGPGVILGVLGFLATPPVHGQSLGDAAAKEKERRRKAAAAEPTPKPSPAADAKGAPATATEYHSESWWRSKARTARDAVADAEAQVKYYEARLEEGKTAAHPATPGDPTSAAPARVMTDAEKREAEASLAVARSQLATAQKNMKDLEEQARREQAPAGWLK